MKIQMLETRRGTEDGFVVRLFEKDKEYDLADCLARTFIAAGRARCIDQYHQPRTIQEAMGALATLPITGGRHV